VLDGANAGTEAHSKTSLIPFTPAQPGSQELIVEATNIPSRWPKLDLGPPLKTKGPWAVGQAVALIRSDAALLIGGGTLTTNVGALALEVDKPYYAVSALGGAAKMLATEDYAKHKAMGMKERLIAPGLNDPSFGEEVVAAVEFLIGHRKERVALRNSISVLISTLAILFLFLGFLFRHDPFGNEPRLVLTTFVGALVGVMLAFLVGHVVDGKTLKIEELLGQFSLASFVGVLYGFFALEAGGFYGVEVANMPLSSVDSLGIKMAILGVGVGALLGPASKKVLEELGKAAKLD